MPRVARITVPGYPHHITQRGNYQQTVFEIGDDFEQYLHWLKEYSQRYSLEIWAYCLMNNHVHFVCVPHREDSLARMFNTLHMRYSQYYNRKKGLRGHLWQGRFFSSVLDEKHVYAAVRYVENNPVRAGLVFKAEDYQWSSAHAHIHNLKDTVLSNNFFLKEEIPDWQVYLNGRDESKVVESLEKNLLTGHPCGSEAFIERIGTIVGRSLKAAPKGRPKK